MIDDGSTDGTAAAAHAAGAAVVRLPFNLGIGGAVQTGFKYALEHGYDLAVRLDGDGQHDPAELPKLIAPAARRRGGHRRRLALRRRAATQYRPPLARRLGIGFFARIVSLLVRQRVTDTTSGFQALNRQRDPALRRRLPARLPGGGGDRDGRAGTGCACSRCRCGCASASTAAPRSRRCARSTTSSRCCWRSSSASSAATPCRWRRRDARSASRSSASIASILLILVVLELIRSRRLRERYALLWLATGVVLLVLSAWRGGLNTIAGWVGVTGYPPAVLFAVATLFILVVLLHYSTVISKLADQNAILAQRLALLEERVRAERRAAATSERCASGPSRAASVGTSSGIAAASRT